MTYGVGNLGPGLGQTQIMLVFFY